MPRNLVSLSWDEPLLPQLVRRLTVSCHGAPWDLRRKLVVVPTQESGRRLRQGLAVAAARAGTGVLAPQILTPEQLIRTFGVTDETASDLAALAAWGEVLTQADLNAFRAVFPSDPPRRYSTWSVCFAQQLLTVQRELAEHGLTFADVATRVEGTSAEPERWTQLAVLERAWNEVLRAHALAGQPAAVLAWAHAETGLTDVDEVTLAAVTDPTPLLLQRVERWSNQCRVEVLVHGPADVFDEWGRPQPPAFEHRALPIGERTRLRVMRDHAAAASFASEVAEGYRAQRQTVAFGLINSEAGAAVQLAFSREALPVHDPAGTSLGSRGLGLLAMQLLRLASDARVNVAAQALRHPLLARYAVHGPRWCADGAELLRWLDELTEKHLPSDLTAALTFARREKRYAGLAAALEWLEDLRLRLHRPGVAGALASALSEVSAAAGEDGGVSDEEVDALRDLVMEATEVEQRFRSFAPQSVVAALQQALQRSRAFRRAEAGAWDLQGWLELVYEEAPHLVLIGFNEGHVPETIQGDLFLPNGLREQLGLRSNRDRLARDHHLLEALLRSRASSGRVDVLVPRLGEDGGPLQPSRLLFRCTDNELVDRARTLFAEPAPPPPLSPRRPAWRLKPLPVVRQPPHFTPSALKSYLACPFRYYLTALLKMEPVEVGTREISPQVFGDLCHTALQRLGENEALQDVMEAPVLADFLCTTLEAEAHERFGVADSFALRVQLASAEARLRAAAEVEAEERSRGWRIVRCEAPWEMKVQDVVFRGRIDRIDRNQETGQYRLIDYKTFDRAKTPDRTHWARHRAHEAHVLAESCFDHEGATWRWTDLQLPLYLLALRPDIGEHVAAGYFILPKTKEETGLRLWTDLSAEHLLHAESCALSIARAVRAGRFWPPAEKLSYEHPTDVLFPDGIPEDVDDALMLALATP